jgi:tRNA (cmo5U34)-methyltransferase
MPDNSRMFLDMFSNRERIAHYADGPWRFTSGIDAVHRMTALLLTEHALADAHVLVLGAGGGAH